MSWLYPDCALPSSLQYEPAILKRVVHICVLPICHNLQDLDTEASQNQ